MAILTESGLIHGVINVQLQPYGDERGRFTEFFRREWFPQRDWRHVQSNRSDSRAGVLRGLHYHFNQVDYWYVISGRLRVGLADLRRSSPTFRCTETFDLDAAENRGLFIPVGVAHGFLALTDVTLVYVVDNYYDGADEHGLAWNDPEVAVPWRSESLPTLSGRDQANPLFRSIPPDTLPK
ncbi:MAG: dTDP-4-dehydrorhamnose 3,5-epimerase family protein [Anaerolineales bacterium]|uniref:dTDP-4-dehydrorhamnose 3,5-epimerase family protein n=1 Tax=Promineifilum sp. TaxID=2664178 RepID=UPI001D3A0210|nr:dTDP-4-dehydrorhamnose 3,5-epimerase family protein [Anaerolineales bacterium]MCO5178440.1 dTDP-4-dehydrorhamnose 3,5-epimerase [Promineifilum sp.]